MTESIAAVVATANPAPTGVAVDVVQARVWNHIASEEVVENVPASGINRTTASKMIRNTTTMTRITGTETIDLEREVIAIEAKAPLTLMTAESIDEQDPGGANGERSDTTTTTVIALPAPAGAHLKGRSRERDTSATTVERTKAEIIGIETHPTPPDLRWPWLRRACPVRIKTPRQTRRRKVESDRRVQSDIIEMFTVSNASYTR